MKHLIIIALLTLLVCIPAAAQTQQYELGVIAIRGEDGRWSLRYVEPGTENMHLASLSSTGREASRLGIYSIMQDPPDRPIPFSSPLWLPFVSQKHDGTIPNDPGWPLQWNMRAIGLRRQSGSEGATIAVLDTGWGWPEDSPEIIAMWDAVDEDNDPTSTVEHGTHVASIALAPHNYLGLAGACGECRAIIVRVCQSMTCAESDIAEGIQFAVANGASVINLSLAGPDDMPYLHQTVDDALEAGVVVVAAAGNYGEMVQYPAAWPGVIAVGAVDVNLSVPWTSGTGPHIAFAAPGVDVPGSCGQDLYCYMSGTSMAAPHVSGAFGLLLTKHPDWTPQQAYDLLKQTAVDLGEDGWDEFCGWGMVQVPQ